MYGCFDPHLVYGFVDPSSDESLDADYVEAHGLRVWASCLVRCHLCSSVYGVRAALAPVGTVAVDPAEKAKVEAFHARFAAHRRARGEAVPPAGYHLALTGEYESEHGTYELDP